MTAPALDCRTDRRRHEVRRQDRNGIDYVEVSDDQLRLTVYFLGAAPDGITVDNVRITGGTRIRDIRVVSVDVCPPADTELDNCMVVHVDRPGDFSTYTLCLVDLPADTPFDPRYRCVDFTFKAACPTDLDCKVDRDCPPETFPAPEIGYLAKDYASFRRLILDRLAVVMPDWKERHVPDLGVTLVELFSYVGDHLSYYQDAVATEAYLGTARQRISVRRHARLVDYAMHEGCNARAWVHVHTSTDTTIPADRLSFLTRFDRAPDVEGRLTRWEDLRDVPADRYRVFEPLVEVPAAELEFRTAHNEIRIHTWGDAECCLPKGATSATLIDAPGGGRPGPDGGEMPGGGGGDGPDGDGQTPDGGGDPAVPDAGGDPATPAPAGSLAVDHAGGANPAAGEGIAGHVSDTPGDGGTSPGDGDGSHGDAGGWLRLRPGDVLIFEEVIGPKTGDPADADPKRRHAVRLTRVERTVDELYNLPLLEVWWDEADALPFPLCVSTVGPAPDCALLEDVTVARGNVVLADHGRRVAGPERLGCVPIESTDATCEREGRPSDVVRRAGRFRPVLEDGPITWSEPLAAGTPAARQLEQDPRAAVPWLRLASRPDPDCGAGWTSDAPPRSWEARRDLLASSREDAHFVVEMDDRRRAHLRFGDGDLGRRPDAGHAFDAAYRVGNGPAGNVGADTIAIAVTDELFSGVTFEPRNPLPARGGTAPEPVAEVKLFAPHAFRQVLARAITAEDYAEIAARHPAVQRAAAELRWNGSWYEVRVAIDPLGAHVADPDLLAEIERYLYPFRRIGHDLAVQPATHVPLDIVLEVCVKPTYLRGHVKAALMRRFGAGRLTDGSLGFFHPDELTFGGSISLSRLVAAAERVSGVESVTVKRLERLFDGPAGEIENGVLPIGPLEIARLDNDPSVPENGRIAFEMRGGR